MKLKRRMMAVLLTLAVMITFMPFVSQQAFAASKSKVQVVTKAKANNGNTAYSYNKKGLISKAVKKTSSKTASKDTATTRTTTYKYNKKNKISKKTTTVVEKVTSYKVDQNTGKTRTANLGTVTTTDKYVTVYTYNKKGLAKKAVTTETSTKSGNETSTYTRRRISGYGELTDGRIIAGYNDRDASGKYVDDEETAANAYYYTGAFNSAVRSGSETYTYRDNGNGSYSVIYDDSVSRTNYTTKPNYKYYMYDANGNAVPCTEDDADFSLTDSVEVVLDPTHDSAETNHSESTVQNKTVTTTTYSYKKGRVSKAVATSVSTRINTSGASSYTEKDSSGTYSSVDNSVDTTTTVDTYTTTTTYSYDKKGRAKKAVYSDNGVENSVSTTVNGLPNRSWTNSDGTSGSEVGSGADAASVFVVQVANGTRTETYTPYKYMETSTYSDGTSNTYVMNETAKQTVETSTVKATPSSATYKYTYDKNGNLKKAVRSGSYTSEETRYNETFGNELFEFDAQGKTITATNVVSHTSKSTTNNENTVKSGTKRLDKSLSMSTESYDGSKETGYDLSGRVVYTLKAKKLSSKLAKLAEQQQWALQNGALNGVVGLN